MAIEAALTYPERRDRLSQEIQGSVSHPVRLAKATSNLFRDRETEQTKSLTVKNFNHLLSIDSDEGTLEVEGMMTYADLVDATLVHGFMPMVVPQLKSITIGGAIAGIGIESTSFRHGLPHETMLEMDVLLADGSVVVCTPDNQYSDLFYGIPNSYGTLGYVLKLKTPALRVQPYVEIHHIRFHDADEFFGEIENYQNSEFDFLDGTVFQPGEYYLTTGKFTSTAPHVSDYTYLDIYYKSIREKVTDYLSVKDYIWRWDTDWFWCSKNLYVQNRMMRRLVGKKRLNSTTYTKVMRWNSKWGITKSLDRLFGLHAESVIQDIDIPIKKAPEFLDFLFREIDLLPIWICPIGTNEASSRFPLFSLSPDSMYVNFGFWGPVRSRESKEPGFLNKKIEAKTSELGGIKSLYSDSYYNPDAFWGTYNGKEFERLKKRYDPQGKFLNLYDKSVLCK